MVFYATFNSISVISWRQITLFMSLLGFTSTRLGSEVSCPTTLARKTPEDPVRLEHRTPGLRVKHFTTETRGTLDFKLELLVKFQKRDPNYLRPQPSKRGKSNEYQQHKVRKGKSSLHDI